MKLIIIIGDNNQININKEQLSNLELLPKDARGELSELPGFIPEQNLCKTPNRLKEIFSKHIRLDGCYVLWTNDNQSIGLSLS